MGASVVAPTNPHHSAQNLHHGDQSRSQPFRSHDILLGSGAHGPAPKISRPRTLYGGCGAHAWAVGPISCTWCPQWAPRADKWVPHSQRPQPAGPCPRNTHLSWDFGAQTWAGEPWRRFMGGRAHKLDLVPKMGTACPQMGPGPTGRTITAHSARVRHGMCMRFGTPPIQHSIVASAWLADQNRKKNVFGSQPRLGHALCLCTGCPTRNSE